ncbi:hypothetical protein [Streptomyces chartreusis]|uniref:hypothetical protein n=1 Tax=Streptomyces chartreusis TaxID=1969 RepID=UPI0036416A60
MSVDRMAESVREHTERYAASRGGRHPLTDCWPWAEAIAAWVETLPDDCHPILERRPWRRDPRIGTDGLTLSIAESIRLAMALWNEPIGDLCIDNVQRVLTDWLKWDRVPGTPEWPAPDGTPHDADWKALFTNDAALADEAASSAYWALEQLEKPWESIPMGEARRRRLSTHGITYARLADVAPLLGLTMPIQVREPGDYVNVPDLLVEQAAA